MPSLCLLLAVLVLITIHETTAHPIRTARWAKIGQYPDVEGRGIWKVFQREARDALSEYTPGASNQNHSWTGDNPDEALEREQAHTLAGSPDRPYKRLSSPSGKSIVSVLVPISPRLLPEQNHRYLYHYHHLQDEERRRKQQQEEEQEQHESTQLANALAHIPMHIPMPYGETLDRESTSSGSNHHKTKPELDNSENGSSASYMMISRHSLSLFSYRISLPYLHIHIEPPRFPLLPLPGLFTTVVILVAMVWIAILTISLVELANYIWRKRPGAGAAVAITDCSAIPSGGGRNAYDALDVPVQIVVASRASEKYGILASESDSDSGSENDMEYRIL
ncbi:hypothetical protein N7474_002179 [Penicillium riverlandense]|uniref:uncharacterized protein n=1 Tax=Penicillium riverlandense TaxID=1903569 RepID=UPI0025473A7A|nr:uncharacterized protein N7474_002179 [Penicillium riverlandense]KAJ5833868.1 hypothetical protein N7474_002179 [Penicillium riverlandense]